MGIKMFAIIMIKLKQKFVASAGYCVMNLNSISMTSCSNTIFEWLDVALSEEPFFNVANFKYQMILVCYFTVS